MRCGAASSERAENRGKPNNEGALRSSQVIEGERSARQNSEVCDSPIGARIRKRILEDERTEDTERKL